MITVIVIAFANMMVADHARNHLVIKRAQEDVEEMAKLAERERIGRDLHDLLGHTLSVIALKSELASKLADHDLPGAIQEIRDVERVSRDALSEVRRAVEGYRQHGLKGELRNASHALEAAGVRLDAQMAPVALPPRDETVLALALREAVTNVVRHAAASSCRVQLTADGAHTVLTIEDDGRGGVHGEGSGLSGMRSRVTEAGGTLEVSGSAGMRLTISVPVRRASVLS
jgi:two-component system sensor histidine kinase DesK